MAKNSPQVLERQHPELSFNYQIRLSQRRTVGLTIKHQQVVLAAPKGSSLTQLEEWLIQKSSWVEKKLAQQKTFHQQIPQRQFCSGELWPFLDAPFTLEVASGTKAISHRHQNSLIILTSNRSRLNPEEQIKQALEKWYKQQALEILTAKTHRLASQLGKTVRAVKVRRTRSKWGHCTRDGAIQYNWLIMQAPEWVVDYLIAHEVCHLFHHNHSKSFWLKVEQTYPDFKKAELWLKQEAHRLAL